MLSNLPKEEFVTGDNIELLCNYIFDINNYISNNKYIGDRDQLIEKQIKEINEREPSSIFVYGHDTPEFLKNIEKIKKPFKLITHNSDLGIFEHYRPYITDKIIQWYGQNNYIKHDKVFSLPIGIARKRWPHGNLDVLKSIMAKNNEKTNLVYKNFDIGTNVHERTNVHIITQNNGILMSNKVNIESYWERISKSIFIVSPKGNGVDCHRIWESLYLKSIPIVEKHQSLIQFKDLPILFIDSWNTVTSDFLRKNIDIFNNTNYENSLNMLKLSYWKDRIQG